MKTLLLCGYRGGREPLGLERDEKGRTLIDRRISALSEMGFEPICVLAGAQADRQLSESRLIQSCELAFDGHPAPDVTSNVRAGLSAVGEEAAFILLVEFTLPEKNILQALAQEYSRVGRATSAPFLGSSGFPLLLTPSGAKLILESAR
jgi:hypothetical protein